MKKIFFFTYILFTAGTNIFATRTFRNHPTKTVKIRKNAANIKNVNRPLDPFAMRRKKNRSITTNTETDASIKKMQTTITYFALVSGVTLTALGILNTYINPQKKHPYDRAVIASGLSLTAAATWKLLTTK